MRPLCGYWCGCVGRSSSNGEAFCSLVNSSTHHPALYSPFRFDWSAEALRAKALIAAGEVDFDLEDVGDMGGEG